MSWERYKIDELTKEAEEKTRKLKSFTLKYNNGVSCGCYRHLIARKQVVQIIRAINTKYRSAKWWRKKLKSKRGD